MVGNTGCTGGYMACFIVPGEEGLAVLGIAK